MRAGDFIALTAELVAAVERVEPDPGPDAGTTDPTDEQYGAMVRTLLSELGVGELWVFAYGSLIWNPEFDVAELRRASCELSVGTDRFACGSLVGAELARFQH